MSALCSSLVWKDSNDDLYNGSIPAPVTVFVTVDEYTSSNLAEPTSTETSKVKKPHKHPWCPFYGLLYSDYLFAYFLIIRIIALLFMRIHTDTHIYICTHIYYV